MSKTLLISWKIPRLPEFKTENVITSRSIRLSNLAGLHRRFGLQTLQIPRDRCHSESASPAFIRHGTLPGIKIAVDLDRIPSLGVPHIVNSDVVVLAPEKRHGIESFAIAQNIFGRHLPLLLSHDPVLYPNALTGMRIGPPRNVPGRKDTLSTG